jgi:Flp pilus assembly protein TadG
VKKRRHSERGASLPEMAFAAVAFFTLLFGIVDFSRALYTYSFVAQLAREGARWWIVRGTTSCTNSGSALNDCNATVAEVQSYVQSLSEGATNAPSIQVSPAPVSCPNGASASASPGCTVSVKVTYPFGFIMGFMPKATLSMSSTSTMVVSQ